MSIFSAYDHLFDTALGLNSQGKIIYFNNQASIFFKLPPRLLKQKSELTELCQFHDFDLKKWLEKSISSSEVLISPEIKLHLVHDPEVDYSIIIKLIPLESEDEKNFLVILQDKTVEKNLHLKYREQLEELKKTHGQILQADKLTTLGELTANISHEINNPLTIAAGHSEIIRDYLKSKSPLDKLSKIQNANQTVVESLERVNQIIRNMKDFLHQSEDQKEYCDLKMVLDTAIEWVQSSAKKANVSIQCDMKGKRIVALVNRVKIEQVLINLIRNSIDAIKEANVENGQIKINVSKSDSENQTIIDIIDNGPGLPGTIKDNLFKPFMTTKEAGSGTGLGLSICSKIIETHRGKLIHIDSTTGCHFQLRLPMIEVYSYTRNDKSLRGSNKQKRILVLDNEVQILNVLNTFISDEGFVFIGSSSPNDALDFLTKAEVQLIITDYSMPDMNGKEFATAARNKGYHGPILYMTSAKFIEQYNNDKKKLEIGGIIIKPFNREDAMQTIISTLKSEGSKA